MKIRFTFWVVLAILGVSLASSYFITSAQAKSAILRIIYLCILLIAVSWTWSALSVRNLELRRSARGYRQQLGQVFEERFEIINHSRFGRSWVYVSDDTDLPGSGGSRVLSALGVNELRNYSAYTLLTERGKFLLGPTAIYSGDPFGLFAVKRSFTGTRELLVLPYMVNLRKFPFPPGLLPGGMAKRLKTQEITPHAAGVREYAPGDSLNRIHWPTTVRRDHLMVKEFDQDPKADIWIFLDADRKIHAHSTSDAQPVRIDQFWLWRHRSQVNIPADSFEYSVSVAASISRYFVLSGQSVGFCSAGQNLLMLPAEPGERQLNKILDTLALIRNEGRLPLLGFIETQIMIVPRGSTVILITAAGGIDLIAAVDSLQRRGMRPVVIFVDPLSFGGPVSIEETVAGVQQRRIPVAVVHNGDDIQDILETQFLKG